MQTSGVNVQGCDKTFRRLVELFTGVAFETSLAIHVNCTQKH